MTETQSSALQLFEASKGDSLRCCFCKDLIISGNRLLELVVENRARYCHWSCALTTIKGVIKVRDERGKSEDL